MRSTIRGAGPPWQHPRRGKAPVRTEQRLLPGPEHACAPTRQGKMMNATKADTRAGVFATLRATPISVRYLLGGVLINQMGAFVQTFLVLYLAVRGFSLGQAGIALTAYSVGAVSGTLLGGELTHRIGPRATIAGAMATSALILGFVPWLSDPGRFGLLLAAIAVAGLATQSYRPAAPV